MTEAEWRASISPGEMLRTVAGKASRRKLLLFSIACCRRMLGSASVKQLQHALDVGDRFADGRAEPRQWQEAFAVVRALAEDGIAMARPFVVLGNFLNTAWAPAPLAEEVANAVILNLTAIPRPNVDEEELEELWSQCTFLRDVVGAVAFRPLPHHPAWQTGDVTTLAQTIYEERAFDRLPILADALEDAGCDDRDVLDHCRNGGEHVRGCWVVDSLLGKQ